MVLITAHWGPAPLKHDDDELLVRASAVLKSQAGARKLVPWETLPPSIADAASPIKKTRSPPSRAPRGALVSLVFNSSSSISPRPRPRPYFFKTDITHDINSRHIRYLEVARILCIWSWMLLNL